MKKILFITLLFLLAISCSNNDVNGLDKDIDGNKLTAEFCINLVRNHWDCNVGAKSTYQNRCDNVVYGHAYYSCYQGDMGKVINQINSIFDEGIDTQKSYYRNYILYLENQSCCGGCPSTVQYTLTVNF